ncbi:MAG TPA: hypothetical protein VEY10_18740, partial [Flavisolibacter sp.]|nr:hypothetical protein [Flavisolibacter sp.]
MPLLREEARAGTAYISPASLATYQPFISPRYTALCNSRNIYAHAYYKGQFLFCVILPASSFAFKHWLKTAQKLN